MCSDSSNSAKLFFLPLETNYPSLAYEQLQNSPVSPPEQKSISPFSRMPYPLSDLTISSPSHYDCIVLIIVLYYCVLLFYYCILFSPLSLASWLLFSNKVQFSSVQILSHSPDGDTECALAEFALSDWHDAVTDWFFFKVWRISYSHLTWHRTWRSILVEQF